MSASLVGSEMCIRDRPVPPRSRGPGRPHQRPRSQRTGWPRAASREGPGAVSYTHLTLPTICSV
eukprot:15264825-Alexandrium_andersonii.AAC.1